MDAYAWVFSQKQNRNHTSSIVFTGRGPLFPKPKTPMKGKRFATIEEMTEKWKQELLAKPKSEIQKCFGGWKKHRRKYIISEGEVVNK